MSQCRFFIRAGFEEKQNAYHSLWFSFVFFYFFFFFYIRFTLAQRWKIINGKFIIKFCIYLYIIYRYKYRLLGLLKNCHLIQSNFCQNNLMNLLYVWVYSSTYASLSSRHKVRGHEDSEYVSFCAWLKTILFQLTRNVSH